MRKLHDSVLRSNYKRYSMKFFRINHGLLEAVEMVKSFPVKIPPA